MRYPEALVHRYGAKAGILMYVARELPDIPQAAMIVNEPGESTKNFLKRADKTPILWPRMFRSSAVVELAGYEGDLPTYKLELVEADASKYKLMVFYPTERRHVYKNCSNEDSFSEYLQNMVNEIKSSTGEGEISVIIAEKSPSSYVGTLVKHPNQDGYYLTCITDESSLEPRYPPYNMGICPLRSNFSYRLHEGVSSVERFLDNVEMTPELEEEVKEVASWHDRIANLPEMDDGWTYQIEFGLDPLCLYQVRPFLEKRKASFRLNSHFDPEAPIVFGVTPPEGINLKVVNWTHTEKGQEEAVLDNSPIAYVDMMRHIGERKTIPNYQAVFMEQCVGFLAHKDIKAIRPSQVAVLYVAQVFPYASGENGWVNIRSDGVNVQIEEIKIPRSGLGLHPMGVIESFIKE